MEIESKALHNRNKVLEAYNNDEQFIHTFFDYRNEQRAYPERLAELSGRPFQRKELASVIRSFMEPFGISQKASEHLEELSEDGVVVIGGQQAGIMTGPLYSVHKAITVILLAEEKRKELGVPVIPVFWVAGEDHDLNEINHVYTESSAGTTKHKYPEKFVLKLMASDATYSHKEMTAFVEDVFRQFGETEHTKLLLEDVVAAVEAEATFTGFFVRLMNGLFQEQGLLFIDSAYKPLREIEKSHFVEFITESEKLATLVFEKETHYSSLGFGRPIEVEQEAAHLFYIHETGRVLLSRKDGVFVNESTGIRFTSEEMLEIANERPWLLSNNVATRPIMQDLVFPVLAFVGGPGEIAYWALLKEAFHLFGIRMPILVPRVSMTFISKRAKQAMEQTSLTLDDVLSGKVEEVREEFIAMLQNKRFENVLAETEMQLKRQYEELAEGASTAMRQLLEKNLKFHEKQLDYLRKKAEEELLIRHETALRKYSILQNEILPEGSLQERIFTPYHFMNEYGPSLVQDLLRQAIKMDGTHQIVYL
ncbi:bacillithiol biosynthesis cysteine-adding enzyme BshC [Sporosarcina sp. ACRSL]|uniref:bacillithiol biosynthesis cysteine-adding enzyme BshC n=1 Tax=Sporosarcina sp. ACRSL TaxID=2918215 RepID=UPI001EF57278|nr:bacillithiol biosynthesis cysteine-adding enzyme BshC [Sporosarcina sp. ACRSL]MCG7342775.1 bacillithiol biosynthesis cysteine-adding enzyme BshC [Sporosarcina sp. ACRSL]